MELSISLRPFTVSDLDDYFVWASDDKVSRFSSWDPYTDKQALLDYITRTVLPHPWFRAICLNGRPVGEIFFTPAAGDSNKCRRELGYVLASESWGKGIATEAVRIALGTVFGEVEGLQRVEALVDVDNVGSQRVLEKCGFTKEGVLRKYWLLKGEARDMIMYSFLSTDCSLED